MFSVYAIVSKNKMYVGQTADLESRLKRHNGLLKNKNTSYTHKNTKGEWKIAYQEIFNTRQKAVKREKELKSYRGRKFLKNLIGRMKL